MKLRVQVFALLLFTGVSAARAQSWYDADWQYRKTITIDRTTVGTVGAPHVDFPYLISEVDADLQTHARADGFDILFTAADGTTKLKHERETWLSPSGTLIAWVKIPSLSTAADTVVYMYYGNSGATEQAQPTLVWDSDFRGVWHMDESAGGTGTTDVYTDSTGNSNDGDDLVSDNGEAGRIGDGQTLDGSDDYVRVPDHSSLNITGQITLEAWVHSSQYDDSNWQEFICKCTTSPRQYLLRPEANTGKLQMVVFDTGQTGYYLASNAALTNNDWYYVAGTYNGTLLEVYINGMQDGSSNIGSITLDTTSHLLTFGRLGSFNFEYLTGSLDELRISNTARSAGWLLTSYRNQEPSITTYMKAAAQQAWNVTGRVFEDTDFAGTATAYDGGVTDAGIPSVDVELYDATNTLVGSSTSVAGGDFDLGYHVDGSYKLRVVSATAGDGDSPPVGGLRGSVPATWPYPLAEMTWGNGSALYGGQDPTVDDTTAPAPGDTYVNVTISGADVTGVELGLAYNLVVNVADDANADSARSAQGSLRQLIKNANAIGTTGSTTANSAEFRMQVPTNQSAGADSWWRITAAAGLPALADGVTVIDGSTQRANAGSDPNTLGPEIELYGGAAGSADGFSVTSAGNEIRELVVNGFSAGGRSGILIDTASATGNAVESCYVGTDAVGGAAVPNEEGISVENGASSNTIGGSNPGEGNLVSGNDTFGILISDDNTDSNRVYGNTVGADRSGTTGLGNLHGVTVRNGPDLSEIGGTGADEGNLIAGNSSYGVYIFGAGSDASLVRGNRIGTAADGISALSGGPNNTRGINLSGFAQSNSIGGTAANEPNTIAFNLGPGIRVSSADTDANRFSANSIFENTGLGIQLNGDGSNDDKPAPVITAVAPGGADFSVVATVVAGDTIELFRVNNAAAPSVAADPSGSGEGFLYLGRCVDNGACTGPHLDAAADANPAAGTVQATALSTGLANGDLLSATAWDAISGTSEFSVNAQSVNTTISGTVFEDANYGGGAGRDQASASGVGRPSARVELYDGAGNFVSFVNTDGSGNYQFPAAPGNHVIRVVNSTVSSSRSGAGPGLWPVQTFRTDASSGTAVVVADHVGGEVPGVEDDGAGSAGVQMNPGTGAFTAVLSGQAQSIAAVTVTASDVTAVDFGLNFDTIVNTNDAGQGSLRQFIANANALDNTGLVQAGRPAGIDNAIFMLADGTVRPGLNAGYASQFSGGVATIQPMPPQYEDILDPVVLDATLQPGYAGAPIVELDGTNTGAGAEGLTIGAGGSTVAGFVIGNFNGSGVLLETAGGNTVRACYIGTDETGDAPAENFQQGIAIDGVGGNTIGGTDASDRNVLSGNRLRAILLIGAGATGNFIRGNYIGTDHDGDSTVPNQIGIYVSDAPGNTIGGAATGAENVISGNSIIGVYLVNAGSSDNTVSGNVIGLNATLTGPLPNASAGVQVATGASNNTIGGPTDDDGNLVASNGGAGVVISGTGTGNAILANTIYDNTALGIDLQLDGVTPNDGVVGTGANNGMDYPVITSALLSDGSLHAAGYVGTPATKIAGVHTIQFFKVDDTPADQNGEIIAGDTLNVPHGEGREYIGQCSGAADGTFDCDVTVPGSVTLAAGDAVAATATDGSSNTSEFGANANLESLALVKRAFQLDGTPVPSGSTLPTEMPVRFLIYVNNPGVAVADVSFQDILDPLFAYEAGSLSYGVAAECAGATCTPVEEAAIFAAADGGTAGTDVVSGADPVGISGVRVYAGNGTAGNQQLDLPADGVWTLVFTVTIQ